MSDYTVVIEPLSAEDGGGFIALVPDLPGCMTDGETREEAARNATDAISEWLNEAARLGRTIPEPSKRLALVERSPGKPERSSAGLP